MFIRSLRWLVSPGWVALCSLQLPREAIRDRWYRWAGRPLGQEMRLGKTTKKSHANPMKRSGSESSQYANMQHNGLIGDSTVINLSRRRVKPPLLEKKTGRCVWVMVLGPNHVFDRQVAGHFAMESIVNCGHSSWPSELNYLIWRRNAPRSCVALENNVLRPESPVPYSAPMKIMFHKKTHKKWTTPIGTVFWSLGGKAFTSWFGNGLDQCRIMSLETSRSACHIFWHGYS